MSLAFHIAKRIAFTKQRSFARFIIRLSVAATAVSVMSMICTLAFVNGFQQTVSNKVFSFWGHIRVQKFEPNKSLVAEETPIKKNNKVVQTIKEAEGYAQVQTFATKSAIIEKNKEIEGVLLKGIEKDYDSVQLKPFMVTGRWPKFNDSTYSKDLLISAQIAKELKIALNDTIRIYFISSINGSRNYRKLVVCGIFKTGIEDYDKLFVLGDQKLIRLMSNWADDETGGYEVFVRDYHQMDFISSQLKDNLPPEWMSKTIQEIYPNIFDWLNIQDVNRNVIFIVMAIVAIINLITCLLILILERTRMVGIFKAIGANDWFIQKLFLYHATVITFAGIGIGFIGGVGLCLLQKYTGFIKLDESAYFVSEAPIYIIWWQVFAICVGTALVCYLSLIIPTWIIKRIQPTKAIQFR